MSDGIHNNKRLLERGASLPSTPPSASEPMVVTEDDAAMLQALSFMVGDPMAKARLAELASTIESQASELVRLRGLESRAKELCDESGLGAAQAFADTETDGARDETNKDIRSDFHMGWITLQNKLRAILSEGNLK